MTGTRRLVVTGASGHLGSFVAAAGLAAGWSVVALVRSSEVDGAPEGVEVVTVDWDDARSVAEGLSAAAGSAVVHCAGLGVRAGARPESLDGLYAANVGTVWRLLSALPDRFEGKVVLVSSAAVYGAGAPTPTPESAPIVADRHYAASKVMAETAATAFAAASDVAVCVARPFNLIGPMEAPDSVVGVIAGQLDAVRPGSDLDVLVREGCSVRDFIDIRDAASALVVLAAEGQPGVAYNVCSGEGTSISELVAAAGSVWGVRARCVETSGGEAPVTTSIGDPSAMRALGWAPSHSLSDALGLLRASRAARG
jgi:GDP-4-dehydro-6-deoxy-D-mannose reductase